MGDAAVEERPLEPVAPEAPPLPAAPEMEPAPEPEPGPRPLPTSEAAPAPTPRRTGRVLIAVGVVVVLVLGAMGVSAYIANASLSSTYSPQRAVTDYFAAQKRGDAVGMMDNATFLRGDGSYSQDFDTIAVAQMLKTPENTDIRDVKITSSQVVDASTQSLTVSMTWNGKQRSQAYTVRKDPARVHYFLYYSWRVDIPYVTIGVKLPNQAGQIGLDGVLLPPGSGTNGIQAIQGFHSLNMYASFLYDSSTQVVDAVDTAPTATFPTNLSTAAAKAVHDAVNKAFGNCDAAKYNTCFGHAYGTPNNDPYTIWSWPVPGHGYVEYTSYYYAVAGDPAATMTLVVGTDPGKLTASGPCAGTLTINGNKDYSLKGDFTATLTINSGTVTANVILNCVRDPA
jgi:hypothetical protein